MAFPVCPFNDFVCDPHAVGSERESEILLFFLFNAPGVCDELLAHLKVHKRLAPEEVHLQILSEAGVFHQEIQRALSGLETHQSRGAVELALRGETVFAAQIARMCHEQTERLDHGISLFHVILVILVDILCKELPGIPQLLDIRKDVCRVLFGQSFGAIFFLEQPPGLFLCLPLVEVLYGVVGRLVRNVDASAEDIQHDIVSVELILMYHLHFLFFTKHTTRAGVLPHPGRLSGSFTVHLSVSLVTKSSGSDHSASLFSQA